MSRARRANSDPLHPRGPNPVAIGLSVLGALRRRRPRPIGSGAVDHEALGPVLQAVAAEGLEGIDLGKVEAYLGHLEAVDPDTLSRQEALAFWINLYNAGALAAARRAWDRGLSTVLRLDGALSRRITTVAGEPLSLHDIEHGKIRRFGDPRVHAALVCGSVSCPTLRREPFSGEHLDRQLDDQMRYFLAAGAVITDRATGIVFLSRVFLWYGGDVVRPYRMPTWIPTRAGRVLHALEPWLDSTVADWIHAARPRVRFQTYDWGLGCRVSPSSATGSTGGVDDRAAEQD